MIYLEKIANFYILILIYFFKILKKYKYNNTSGKDEQNSGKDEQNSGKDEQNSGKDEQNSGKDEQIFICLFLYIFLKF